VYVNADNVPSYLKWLPRTSMIKHAYEALCVNEFCGSDFETVGQEGDLATGQQVRTAAYSLASHFQDQACAHTRSQEVLTAASGRPGLGSDGTWQQNSVSVKTLLLPGLSYCACRIPREQASVSLHCTPRCRSVADSE